MSRIVKQSCAVVLISLLLACRSGIELTKPHRVKRQDLAGSTYVSVLSIAPWDDYVEALQPKFTITADSALEKVIPTTRAEDERLLHSLSAALKLAPPTSTLETEVVKGDGDNDKDKSTEKEGPGSLADAKFENLDDTTDLPDGPPKILETTLKTDPMLQHLVATALFQEVQLLSRYVKDAARRREMAAYVVRLQITVMPDARNEPYDAYSNISFFYGPPVPPTLLVEDKPKQDGTGATGAGPTKNRARDTGKIVVRTLSANENAEVLDTLFGVNAASPHKPENALAAGQQYVWDGPLPCSGVEAPSISPLFVTDNLEGSIHGHTTESIRQLMAMVVVLSNNFAANASTRFRSDLLRSVLGRDLNSLLTVARINDNTIRVRLGAVQAPTGSYAMVPQTHNVTLLVMVPKEARRNETCKDIDIVRFISKTSFVDAKTGKALPERGAFTEAMLIARIIDTLEDYGVKIHWSPVQEARAKYLNLVLFAATNNRQGFRHQFQKILDLERSRNDCKDPEQASLFFPCLSRFTRDIVEDGVWMELVNLTSGGPWHIGTFQLPKVAPPHLPPLQNVLLIDDGKKTATVAIPGGRHLRKESITAELLVKEDGALRNLQPLQVDISPAGDTVRLTFSSPSKFVKSAPDAVYHLSLGYRDNPREEWDGINGFTMKVFDECCVRYSGPDKDPPGDSVRMNVSSRQIRTENGNGRLKLEIERDAESKDVVRFDVVGADVVGFTGDPEAMFDAAKPRIIQKSGTVTLILGNLSPNVPVEVSLKKIGTGGAAANLGKTVFLTVLENRPSEPVATIPRQ